ncbi:phage major capsid protein, P2 family [Brevundimonas sp. A19_0]|uniref:phage major capsid protein, P2 family n=1 Tax=Brevundimonas sp. A19_0 TaxID=2821087 RepID=UPI001ADC5011|nr:phage major capsid protein, P2 family [Brevundimonas sp. A19_0]MBO9500770.1 phage major capsid protein, P2 family [Brevundimonas sp. A19_0]
MRNTTRVAYNNWLDQQARINEVDGQTVRSEKAFTVAPSVQQRLIEKQQESSAFLSSINIVPVPEQSGEKIGLGIGSTLAGRTNTDANDRPTQDPTTLDKDGFLTKQTNSDTHVSYAKLDLWSKFPNFQQRLSGQVVQQQARDRIIIGFNGTSAAAQTDRGANPLLQDVNVGWCEKIRVNKPTHVFDEGATEAGLIIIDPAGNGDYRNLDALVYDAIHSFLPAWVRADTALECLVGDGLLHEKYFPMVDQEEKPTERLALDVLMSKKQLGGRPAGRVAYMLENGILITPRKNLSIYEHEGTRRRTVVDNAKRSRIETYESVNEDYVVEDHDWALLIENIQFGPTPAP